MTDDEIRSILYGKRQAKEDYKCIDFLDRELSYRTGRKKDEERVNLDQKKAEVDILDVIESYTTIGRFRQGSLIKCPLPDHNDGSPSFSINTKKNCWKCFGCGRGGGQIDFIMFMEGCSLADAIKKFLQY